MKTHAWFSFLALAIVSAPAFAFSPVITKLHGRTSTGSQDDRFGRSVAMNQSWIVVGQAFDDDVGADAGAVHVFDIKGRYFRKLKASDGAVGHQFGRSAAISGSLIAVGAPLDDDAAPSGGSVYLYSTASAATSKHLIKLTSPNPALAEEFGSSVAFTGKYLLVGAPGADGVKTDCGCVYVYEVKPSVTGAGMVTLIHQLFAAEPGQGDRYGFSVSGSGRLGVVGAPYCTPGNPAPLGAGAVYVVDLEVGTEISRLKAPDAQSGDSFGFSVAACGKYLVGGAPNATVATVQSGKAYLCDMTTGAFIAQYYSDTPHTDDHFGFSVALGTHLALVGAPDYDEGASMDLGLAAFFEVPSVTGFGMLNIPTLRPGDHLGGAVALYENLAVVAAEGDDALADNAGAAYLIDPINGKLPLRTIVRKGDYAEGVDGALFGNIQSAVVSPIGGVSIGALMGPVGSLPGSTFGGVPAGPAVSATDTGIWSTLMGQLDLLAKSKDILPGGQKIGGVSNPLFNQNTVSVFQAKLSGGTGVTTANNQLIMSDDGSSVDPVARTGVAVGAIGGAMFGSFQQMIQPRGTSGEVDIAYKLKTGPGTPPTTAANDTGVAALLGGSLHNVADATPREGNPIPGSPGSVFQQFMGRVSGDAGRLCIASYVGGGAITGQALVTNYGMAGWANTVFQGHPAFGAGGSSYGAMLGETLTTLGHLVYRTTFTGLNATAANNEGISRELTGLLMRKGDPVWSGVKFNRFVNFWPGPNDQVLVLASLAGTGVNPANDMVLLLYQENGTLLPLLREGDTTGSPDGSTVATISRVDVDPLAGHYVILAVLKAAASTNQALFTGCTSRGNATTSRALRLPALRLRKGGMYQARPGYTARILSLALSATVTDQTGAGGKGLAQIVNVSGQTTVTVQFDNKVTEVMLGTP